MVVKDKLYPTSEEVVAAVKSLYADRLEPHGRILLCRIREMWSKGSNHSEEEVPKINPKVLRRVCWACQELQVLPAEGKEFSVRLMHQATDFVDVCSPIDPFPAEFWHQAKAYFGSLSEGELVLPGGRYACAQALMEKKLPLLEQLSLAEVCHFVQMSVSQRKILGFTKGGMVPYGHSETSFKEECAAKQWRFGHSERQDTSWWGTATWEQTRACIAAILQTSNGPEPCVVTMSNVKRLFLSRFGLNLSETALGHSRLSDLLQDPRLSDVCTLKACGTGQCLVRKNPPALDEIAPDFLWMADDGSTCGWVQGWTAAAAAMAESGAVDDKAVWDPWQQTGMDAPTAVPFGQWEEEDEPEWCPLGINGPPAGSIGPCKFFR